MWFYGSTLISTHSHTTTQIIRFNPIERVRDEAQCHTESALFQHFSTLAYINSARRGGKRFKTDKMLEKQQIKDDKKELRLSTKTTKRTSDVRHQTIHVKRRKLEDAENKLTTYCLN